MTLPKRVVLESWGTLWCCHIFFTDWEALTWFLHTLTLVVLLIREARMLSIVTYIYMHIGALRTRDWKYGSTWPMLKETIANSLSMLLQFFCL